MNLRGYQSGDLDAMHALDVLCFDAPFCFSRSAMHRFATARKASVTIADRTGQLLGFCILHIDKMQTMQVGYIVTLDVSPAHRRHGLARLLMQRAEQQAAEADCSLMVLHVFTGNAVAIAFYRSRGYTQTHREASFYGPHLDAFVYAKQLSA